jgi:hypothetical protein
MQLYPTMNIRFPEDKQSELVAAMKARARAPWCYEQRDEYRPLVNEGYVPFHRDGVDSDPGCGLFLFPKAPGDLEVVCVVAEKGNLSPDQYVAILREFDATIAEPAAGALGGMTSIDIATPRLVDYFSRESICLLKRFCTTSNVSTGSAHPSDQEKWIAFLLDAHRSDARVGCEIFGQCLEAEGLWPCDRIEELMLEYDFGLHLLREYDRTGHIAV